MKRKLTADEALRVIEQRMLARAEILEGVRLTAYDMAVLELRRFAKMMAAAREHLKDNEKAP